MQKNYFLLAFLISFSVFSQDKKNNMLKFDTSGMKTAILMHKSPVVNILNYNDNTINTYSFYQAYKAMAQGDLLERLLPLESIKEQTKQSYFTKVIPLAILHSDFESIHDDALQNNAISKDTEGYLIRTNPDSEIFKIEHITIASPLRASTKGLQTTFNLASSNVFNTTTQGIDAIVIDFDDSDGYRPINLNQNIVINYSEPGRKTLNIELTLDNGEIINRSAIIDVKYSNADLHTLFNRVVTTFNSSTAPDLSDYNSEPNNVGTGEYEIILGADGVLNKPIILVDGFDPGDGRDITGLRELLNFDDGGTTSNLEDLVKAEGFDVVYLNFPIYTRASDGAVIDGGVDYIERNAMLLIDLIETLNTDKVGTEQNVIIGPSMGGLISRYALNYMENEASMDHDTRLWISFDSPHHGANVPIGFQHQFNFLAFGLDDFWILGDQNVEELQPIIDGMLKSSAARQMLTDQFESHITNSDGVTFNSTLATPRSHPYKIDFDASMNSLTATGFPELTRNITIINGSGENTRYPDNTAGANDLIPGSQILDANINIMLGADMKIQTFFTPNAGTQIETSKVHLDFAWWFPLANDRINNAESRAHPYSNGIDAASGGLFDILKLTEDLATDGLVGEFLGALDTDHFNFIPSVSAMAFEISSGEIDWFHAPSGVTTARATTNVTPFDAWYMPDINEPHVTLTELNVDFALNEIFQETLSTDVNNQNTISLAQNPVTDVLTILCSNTVNQANVSVVDLTGKMVYHNTLNLQEVTNIPLNISSGLYILNIETQENYTFKTKFIVQ